MKELVGRKIIGIDLATDKMAIRFHTDGKLLVYLVDADCCSHTWIEHLEGVDRILGRVVTAVEAVPLPGSSEDGELVVYGMKITADGDAVLDFRNKSNGYYGGRLVLKDGEDSFYGVVHGQNISDEEWETVTKDF